MDSKFDGFLLDAKLLASLNFFLYLISLDTHALQELKTDIFHKALFISSTDTSSTQRCRLLT